MGKRRKVDMGDGLSVEDAGPDPQPIAPDLSGVMDWTVADLLDHIGVPVDKVSAELAAFVRQHPNAQIPAGLLANILANYFTRGAIERAVNTIGAGLWQVAQAGHGESGHAGAELA